MSRTKKVTPAEIEAVAKDVADILISKLYAKNISVLKSREIARAVLAKLERVVYQGDLENALEELANKFYELNLILDKRKEVKEIYAKRVSAQCVHQLIIEGKVDVATEVIQKAMNGEIHTEVTKRHIEFSEQEIDQEIS